MSGILVVERSTTLSHLLRRTLAAAGFAPRSELAAYLDAIDHLQRSAELEQNYGMLIVGAPGTRASRRHSSSPFPSGRK